MRRFIVLSLVLSACHRAPDGPPPAADPVDASPATLAARVASTDPSVLSESLETAAQIEPTLAVGPGGKLAIAWMSPSGEHSSVIGVRFSSDGGATWSTVKKVVSPGGRTAADPSIAVDSKGIFTLAWLGDGPDPSAGTVDSRIYVARSDASSEGLGPPVEVSDHRHRDARLSKPWLSVTEAGAVIVTWGYSSSMGDGIAIARAGDGQTWTQDVVLERIGLQATFPFTCTSAHGDRVWVVYLDSEAVQGGETRRLVRIRASDDGGIAWSPSRGTTASSVDERPRLAVATPVCAGDGEDVTIAYGLSADPSAHALDAIVVARSLDGGRTFDSRRTFEGGSSLMMHPQLVREAGGDLDLAFYAAGPTRDAGALRWFHTDASRAPLGPSKILRTGFRFDPTPGAPGWPGAYFGLGWRADTLYAASIDNSGEMTHVAFSKVATK